ncbi:putative DNA-binding transcriptional regulator YafY [Prauserella shujinwangii]|uniref:Putative DNA-binding transcriptional regulator YafY n=1 Tax=Prauserella shujinwangii TaxID=1453103 RepID=A0A2T0LXA9_9PSEU|nr:YafY family protein [Prauserella shujinwangii]PRX48658.1 putative DNA-binding transcriptional regulator YafY [Prauserella shujinwangii]
MLETSARLLRLLSLLQTPRTWTGADLADRLGVDVRTVRRDIDKLRALGYPVDANPGVPGYRLGAGATLPPLLLDDDEAIAVAVGLRTAAGGTVAGIEEASLRALTKLEQVLPARLRHRVTMLHAHTVTVADAGPAVDPETLTAVAAACRDRHQLRFDYRTHDGTTALRRAEPHRLVHAGRRWYLVGWDVDRADWRTYRVDRLRPRIPTGPRFTVRDAPEDLAGFLVHGVSTAPYRYQARVTVEAPAAAVAERVPATAGTVEATGPRSCVLRAGSNSLDEIALYVGLLGAPFRVHEPVELADRLRELGSRLLDAAG